MFVPYLYELVVPIRNFSEIR